MSSQVPTTFVTLFENNMKLSLQQSTAMLAPYAMQRDVSGEKVQLDDLIGHVQAQDYVDRHGDVQLSNTPHSRLWIAKPTPQGYAEMVDRDDQIQAKIALESGYMQTAVATINRSWDDACIGGLFGNMLTGKDGTTSTAFPGANVVAVTVGAAAATRMNVAKLRAARKMLAQNFNDPAEERFIALTAEQIDDLLNEVPVTSKDFGAMGGELRDGKLSRFLGFNMIEIELGNSLFRNAATTLDGSGYRKNPFWVKSGLLLAVWQKIYTDISPVPMKRNSRLIQADTTIAATRTEAGKVGYILNSEA
jgi:hypothetical protein